MKKKIFITLLTLIMAISVVGCGRNTSNSTIDSSQKSSVSTDTEIQNTSKDTTDVYPNAIGITEVKMGVTEDICTFKVPLNYVLAGSYYDENNEEHVIKGLNSATTTVEEAIAEGGFSTGNHLASFSMGDTEFNQTRLDVSIYPKDIMTWNDFKTYYSEAKKIGTDNLPALLYHVDALDGQAVAIAIKLSDDITMQIVYEGSLENEIEEDELGQRLYDLVTLL